MSSQAYFDLPHVLSEFMSQSDKERQQNLWMVDQLERYRDRELSVFDWNYLAANDNDTPCHRYPNVGQYSLVRLSPPFRNLLVLWRECQYDVLLTKLAFAT